MNLQVSVLQCLRDNKTCSAVTIAVELGWTKKAVNSTLYALEVCGLVCKREQIGTAPVWKLASRESLIRTQLDLGSLLAWIEGELSRFDGSPQHS